MRKTGVLFLVVTLVILLYCAGSGTVAAGMQAERTRSAKPQVSQVSSGSDFTAAVKADGTLWTWGYDQRAARGINTFRPGQVGSDTNWSTVSAGGNQISAVIAALKTDGTLWTWSGNMHGQIGDGTLPVGDRARYSPFRNAPAPVSLAPDNGAEARPGAPKMVRLYPRALINGPAALGGEPVPFMENSRTLVPLRFVSEALGAAVIRTDVGTIIVRLQN